MTATERGLGCLYRVMTDAKGRRVSDEDRVREDESLRMRDCGRPIAAGEYCAEHGARVMRRLFESKADCERRIETLDRRIEELRALGIAEPDP